MVSFDELTTFVFFSSSTFILTMPHTGTKPIFFTLTWLKVTIIKIKILHGSHFVTVHVSVVGQKMAIMIVTMIYSTYMYIIQCNQGRKEELHN